MSNKSFSMFDASPNRCSQRWAHPQQNWRFWTVRRVETQRSKFVCNIRFRQKQLKSHKNTHSNTQEIIRVFMHCSCKVYPDLAFPNFPATPWPLLPLNWEHVLYSSVSPFSESNESNDYQGQIWHSTCVCPRFESHKTHEELVICTGKTYPCWGICSIQYPPVLADIQYGM